MLINGKIKTLLLGLGNPILSDDSVGWRVAAEIESKYNYEEITIRKADLGSLNILELLIGYDSAILVDAIKTESGKIGSVYRLTLDEITFKKNTAYAHGISLAAALEIGKGLDLILPGKIVIFAVEVLETNTFSEKLTPEVESAVPVCADMIARELNLQVFQDK